MNIFITGEKGFIGKNLVAAMPYFYNMNHISGDPELNKKVKAIFYDLEFHTPGEPCVYRNTISEWRHFFLSNKVDVVIHNAATVGTDVVALNADHSTSTNVQGTYNICRAAKLLDIPVCYMGTTVIYDTQKYQDEYIVEDSDLKPTTLYGCQKLCAEHIVKSQTNKWMIVRPLFAYGGEGDMNSLIAKTIYGALNGKTKIDMFLDPDKIKDYMHVSDYCVGVLQCIHNNLWGNDWNLASESPYTTREIVNMISEITGKDLSSVIKWHSKTDYLGNHRLSSKKVRKVIGWKPLVTLEQGIKMSLQSIISAGDYNPLKHLEEAKAKNIDLTDYFPEF